MATNSNGDSVQYTNDSIIQEEQKQLIERKRLKASELLQNKRAKMNSISNNNNNNNNNNSSNNSYFREVNTHYTDSNAGFIINEKPQIKNPQYKQVTPTIQRESAICDDCQKEFKNSYLMRNFEILICENCFDKDGKHKLITTTNIKQNYFLTDKQLSDLKFIIKRNPRNQQWNSMRLYLEFQIIEKANSIWGGPEYIDIEKKRRQQISHKIKRSKYEKEMQQLRLAAKTEISEFRQKTHIHKYEDEDAIYNVNFDTNNSTDSNDDIVYRKTCIECGFVLEYEKL